MTRACTALASAWFACVAAGQAAAPPAELLDQGLLAYKDARYEDAARALRAALAARPSYEGWLTLGLALGRLERFGEARAAFDAALRLDARRPEAWVESGGLAFLERDYPRAARDLERALERGSTGDDYARDLLASSLHLLGRSDDALRLWNRAGRPLLTRVRLSGLVATREVVVRRELSLREGGLLDLGELRRSRLRLRELQAFERVTLRPVPEGEGRAELELALLERHGFFASRADFIASSLMNALQGRARLRYTNLDGAALNLGGELRWQQNRPRAALTGEWPRPFGVPATLRLEGFRGRQLYDVDGEVLLRSRGAGLVLRHVAGPGSIVQLDLRARQRRFSAARPDARGGLVFGGELGLEQRLLESQRLTLDAGVRAFHTLPGTRPGLRFFRGVATLEGRALLAAPDGSSLERSVLALRLRAGQAGRDAPLDELFAPGGSPEMELPLRAHRQLRRGVVGATPLGRSIALANLEWRRRVLNATALQVGVAIFYDGARIAGRPGVGPRVLHDVGLGLRLQLRGAQALRVDFGHGLSDGRNAMFLGLGQVF